MPEIARAGVPEILARLGLNFAQRPFRPRRLAAAPGALASGGAQTRHSGQATVFVSPASRVTLTFCCGRSGAVKKQVPIHSGSRSLAVAA